MLEKGERTQQHCSYNTGTQKRRDGVKKETCWAGIKTFLWPRTIHRRSPDWGDAVLKGVENQETPNESKAALKLLHSSLVVKKLECVLRDMSGVYPYILVWYVAPALLLV